MLLLREISFSGNISLTTYRNSFRVPVAVVTETLVAFGNVNHQSMITKILKAIIGSNVTSNWNCWPYSYHRRMKGPWMFVCTFCWVGEALEPLICLTFSIDHVSSKFFIDFFIKTGLGHWFKECKLYSKRNKHLTIMDESLNKITLRKWSTAARELFQCDSFPKNELEVDNLYM